jgi:hypothetical protein
MGAREGELVLARVYGDVTRLNGWQEAHRYRVVHVRPGKNATDLVLSLDALELALARRFDVCVIAASDGDYTHLAERLREHGLRVVGTGEAKTPRLFREVCSKFHKLDAPKSAANAGTALQEPSETDRDRQIRALVCEHDDGNGMTIQTLGSLMNGRYATACKDIAEGSWRTYLERRPSLYLVELKGSGDRFRLRAAIQRA